MTIQLRTPAEVEAYYQARRWVAIAGFVAALIGLALATSVALTDGPLWLVTLVAVTIIPNMLITSGWVPKVLRPMRSAPEGDGAM